MHTTPLRRLVSAIGLTVAIVPSVVVPVGYFIEGYSDTVRAVTFRGKLSAARVAQYIYSHSAMWQYQQQRLVELIQLPEVAEQPINQKVYDASGQLVMDESVSLSKPIVVRRIPIVVSGAPVGSFVVEASLDDVLRKNGGVGL